MTLKTFLLSVLGLIAFTTSFAQDKIYKRDGDIIDGKVLEVGIKNISYKKNDNPDGPGYTVNKHDVEKIVYQNGSEDTFEEEVAGPRMPHHPFGKNRKTSNKLNYGNNIIALAPLQLINDNIEGGVGLSLSYERVLDKNGIISLYFPVILSFNNNTDYNNYNGYNNPSSNSTYSTVYFMPGIKFYPTGSHGLIRYAVGPSFVFASGQQPYSYTTFDPNGNPVYAQGVKNYSLFGVMVNNSMNIFPTPHLYLGLELGLGASYFTHADNNANYNNTNNSNPLVQFSFKVGYRF